MTMPNWVKDGAEVIVVAKNFRGATSLQPWTVTRHTAKTVWVTNGAQERRFRFTKAGLTEEGHAGRIDAPALMEATDYWKMEMKRVNLKPLAVIAVERFLMARTTDNARRAADRLDEWIKSEAEANMAYVALQAPKDEAVVEEQAALARREAKEWAKTHKQPSPDRLSGTGLEPD